MDLVLDRDDQPDIVRPTLLLDGQKARRNIERMAGKAAAAGVRLRPHFKSHQATEVGRWFRPFGVDAITVSSVEMAHQFAHDQWSDITIAFPVNLLQVDVIDRLAASLRLGLLVDSAAAISFLADNLRREVQVWLKVDVGYGRAGVRWDRVDQVVALAQSIVQARPLRLAGLLTHSGHSYQADSAERIRSIHAETVARLTDLKNEIEAKTRRRCAISIGDTPTCSLVDDFAGVDEIRPGNFVFYDVMQLLLGSCRSEDIAVAMACPVVGTYAERGQIVVYGGAVHLSAASVRDRHGRRIYGYLAEWRNGTFGPAVLEAPVVALSQEHGVVQLDGPLLREVSIGDVVCILPAHSCLTCAAQEEYRLTSGEIISRR